MLLLGLDIGSSSIKASIVDAEKGYSLASAHFPPKEMEIISTHPDWAEQDPEVWISNLFQAIGKLKEKFKGNFHDVGAIGITYQMHGLVIIDKNGQLIRNAIIWCDSRAFDIGGKALEDLGESYFKHNLLNSPGNFTASKLRWVKENEPESYERIYKFMLPGDFVAYRLTGELCTTISGLSEGIFWDFTANSISHKLLDYYGISQDLIPRVVPTFSKQGELKKDIANKLGLKPGIPITYRAGDQPNNAFSLNVLNPGEIAASAGTSGVLYAISNSITPEPKFRINSFVHVNHSPLNPRIGQLMCINGTGIANAWIKSNCNPKGYTYEMMNNLAAKLPPGAGGINILPFGNGAERILENKFIGCSIHGISFKHNQSYLYRAIQEGIAYSFKYGLSILKETGTMPITIKAGKGNLFQSKLFCEILSSITGLSIEKYDTNGATGAAIGAALGYGYFKSEQECHMGLEKIYKISPTPELAEIYNELYAHWQKLLFTELNNLS